MKPSRFELASACVAMLLSARSGAAGSAQWRLQDALNLPASVTVAGSYRVRYKSLDHSFRPRTDGFDHLRVERLLVGGEWRLGALHAGAEIQDSRAQLADSGTPLGTDDVNAIEPLRMYAGFRRDDVWSGGDHLYVEAGRITFDLGSRRLAARNRFRNTLNAFTGARAAWSSESGDALEAFCRRRACSLPPASGSVTEAG